MPDVNLPLSGAVTQTINPWAAYLTAIGSQFGLININVGQSSNPDIERAVLDEVGSYGMQIGRTEEALLVVLDVLLKPDLALTPDQQRAVDDFRAMIKEVARRKERLGARHYLPR